MTVSSGFFDSVNHDRLYNADQVSSMFDGLILDGVYENMGEAFAINAYPDAENTVIVGTGRAWFDHTWTLNDTQYALTLDPPSDSMSRIDAIVLDVDKTLEVRNNNIKLLKGTPVFIGADPQKPTLVKEDLHNQYPLAYVTRSAGASTTINQADIEYMVGTDECPMVIGLLEAINIEQVYAQLKDEFYLWWDGVILGDPDMATHLQEQIDAIEKKVNSGLTGLLENEIAEKFMSGKFDISVSSYSINMKNAPSKIDPFNNETVSPTNSFGNGNNRDRLPVLFILPDGYICAMQNIGYDMVNKDGQVDFTTMLVNTDGVATYTQFSLRDVVEPIFEQYIEEHTSPHISWWYSIADMRPIVYYYQIDTYPIVIKHAFHIKYANGDIINFLFTLTTTITAAHQVSYKLNGTVGPFPRDSGSVSHLEIGTCVGRKNITNNDNMIMFGLTASGNSATATTTSMQYLYKIDKNDAISFIQPSFTSCVPSNTGFPLYYDDETNEFRYYKNASVWTSINASTLEGTYHTDTTTIPDFYPVTDSVSMYTLSEQNGVVEKKSVIGSVHGTYEEIKKSNYFLGANNSNLAIVEGSFTCRNDNGRLFGFGPNGENIAIGSNGGAAMLKKKSSASSGISSIDKVVDWFPGMKNIPGIGTIYIEFSQNKNESTADQLISAKVVTIKEG